MSLSEQIFIFVYPFVSIISPLIGIAAMISCKAKNYQTQASFNHLSLFTNTLALLITCIAQKNFQFEFLISILLFITKIILAALLPLQISYFNNPKYDKNMIFLEELFSPLPNNHISLGPSYLSSDFSGFSLVRLKKKKETDKKKKISDALGEDDNSMITDHSVGGKGASSNPSHYLNNYKSVSRLMDNKYDQHYIPQEEQEDMYEENLDTKGNFFETLDPNAQGLHFDSKIGSVVSPIKEIQHLSGGKKGMFGFGKKKRDSIKTD